MHKSDKCATLYRQPDRCGNAKIIISATSPKLTKIRGENYRNESTSQIGQIKYSQSLRSIHKHLYAQRVYR